MFEVAVRKVKRMLREKDDRQWLLKMMPRNSVCAEIGVYQGRFTECILPIVRPKMLHLLTHGNISPAQSSEALYTEQKCPVAKSAWIVCTPISREHSTVKMYKFIAEPCRAIHSVSGELLRLDLCRWRSSLRRR
jgi:hypothetical protein